MSSVKFNTHQLCCILIPDTLQVIRPNGEEFTFELDSFKKHCLLNGLDKIGLTLDKEDKISSFEKERSKNYPWLDGASMKVPEKVAMYADAPINVAA